MYGPNAVFNYFLHLLQRRYRDKPSPVFFVRCEIIIKHNKNQPNNFARNHHFIHKKVEAYTRNSKQTTKRGARWIIHVGVIFNFKRNDWLTWVRNTPLVVLLLFFSVIDILLLFVHTAQAYRNSPVGAVSVFLFCLNWETHGQQDKIVHWICQARWKKWCLINDFCGTNF